MSSEWKIVGEKKPRKKKPVKKQVTKPSLPSEEDKIIALLRKQSEEYWATLKENPKGVYFTSSVYVVGPPSKTIVHKPHKIL